MDTIAAVRNRILQLCGEHEISINKLATISATPFIRGIIAELGFGKVEIPYEQAKRRAGKTHNNFNTLYDAAMLSFTTYTKTPIRAIGVLGWLMLVASVLGGAACLTLHLLDFWIGQLWLIPVVALFSAINLISLSLLGEYILLLRSKIMKRPLVIEEERINFENHSEKGE